MGETFTHKCSDTDCPYLGKSSPTNCGCHIRAADLMAESRAELLEALELARRIIREVDEYQKRPDSGDWGVECACCMGELLDDDRDAIASIDAALAKARGQ